MSFDYTQLRNYLLMDYWDEREVPAILAGRYPSIYYFTDFWHQEATERDLLPTMMMEIENDPPRFLFPNEEYDPNTGELAERYNASIFSRSEHPKDSFRNVNNPPLYDGKREASIEYKVKYCIEWARKKRIDIPWLEWAIENGFVEPETTEEKEQPKEQPKELAGKTKNTMLRTIEALAEIAINGLTGEPHPDADACIKAMELKGIAPPIKSRALADYLKEAKKLK